MKKQAIAPKRMLSLMMFNPHSRFRLQQSQKECYKFFPKRTKNAIRGGKDRRKDRNLRDREYLTHQVQTLRVMRKKSDNFDILSSSSKSDSVDISDRCKIKNQNLV